MQAEEIHHRASLQSVPDDQKYHSQTLALHSLLLTSDTSPLTMTRGPGSRSGSWAGSLHACSSPSSLDSRAQGPGCGGRVGAEGAPAEEEGGR